MALLFVVVAPAAVGQESAGDALKLGHELLERNEPDSAEAAFKQAVKLGEKAKGLNGVGLSLVAKGKSYYRQAFRTYRQALGADRSFVEAQLNIARLHAHLRDRDTKGAYRKAIKMAPDVPESYIELANFLVDTEGNDSGPEVEKLLTAYMEREPSDPAGYVLWTQSLADRAMVRQIRNVSGYLLERFPEETRFLPAIAQAEAAAGQVQVAMDHWRRFLAAADAETRAVYDDLANVASAEVLGELQVAEDREAYLTRFWRDRDASSGLTGDGARSEHYRRVWFAMRNFSDGATPWDKRGDVYVRYGEPDYRSRSGYPNPPPSGAAELVRDRLSNDIGVDPRGASTEFENADAFFAERQDSRTVLEAPVAEPVYPLIGVGDVRWESWIYTRIGGGIEFVFVDIALNGNFRFPEPPSGADVPMRVLAKLTEYHPARVYAQMAVEQPQAYDYPFGYEPLEFYYDTAAFRGSAGRTRLEVYYGVPTAHLERAKLKDGRTIHAVERTLTLQGEEAFRKNDVGGYAAPEGDPDRTLIEVATLEAPAGPYRLTVEALDRASGRWGLYTQEIEIPAFPDSLSLSELTFAWTISTTPADDRFRKHVDGLDPNTDVWVIPLPSRSYRKGRPFHVYYEVYGLTKNEFGQTSYEVTYTVDQQIRKGAGVFGAMASLFKSAMADREPQLSIGYEATGETTDEPIYIELDTKELKPGYNRITVTVTDKVSGQVAKRQAVLRLVAG